LGSFLKLFDFWTLFEFFLLGIQLLNHFWRECVFATIKVFAEPIAPSSDCFTATETLLGDTRTTDMKPHMIGAVGSLEILAVFGIGRREIGLLVLEDFCHHGSGLSLHIFLNEVFNETLEFIVLNFIPRLSICKGTLLDDGGGWFHCDVLWLVRPNGGHFKDIQVWTRINLC